jgi:hypothetical protein
MSDCIHVHLIKQVGPMDGGERSTRYRCQECSESLHAAVSIITVHKGVDTANTVPGAGDPIKEELWQVIKQLYERFHHGSFTNWPAIANRLTVWLAAREPVDPIVNRCLELATFLEKPRQDEAEAESWYPRIALDRGALELRNLAKWIQEQRTKPASPALALETPAPLPMQCPKCGGSFTEWLLHSCAAPGTREKETSAALPANELESATVTIPDGTYGNALRPKEQQLREALAVALPILKDRSAGGRMLTSKESAQKAVTLCEAALAGGAESEPSQ